VIILRGFGKLVKSVDKQAKAFTLTDGPIPQKFRESRLNIAIRNLKYPVSLPWCLYGLLPNFG
jgi:hypothetical protein